MGFHVGQIVECIDADFVYPGSPLRWRGLYEVARCGHSPYGHVGRYKGETLGVWLAGLPNPFSPDKAFAAARFRPLPESRLDVFRSMLVPTELERLEIISEDIADDIVELERSWRT